MESIQLQSTASLTVSSMSHGGVGVQADSESGKREDPPIEVFKDQQNGSNEIWSPGLHSRRRFSVPYKQEADQLNSLEYQGERPLSNNSNNEDGDYFATESYELPESTHTFLITERIMSFGFVTGILTTILCLTILGLALFDQVKTGDPDNWFGLEPEVSPVVHVARYVAILIAVFNEQEIPTALEIIGKGLEQVPSSTGDVISMRRIMFSSILGMLVGMFFFVAMSVCIVQSASVLEIFFNLLTLKFVEKIDEAIFAMSRRGVFGRPLLIAARPRFIKTAKPERGQPLSTASVQTKRCIRFICAFNVCFGMGMLTLYTTKQRLGEYRCKSITVYLGDGSGMTATAPDEFWAGAYCRTDDCSFHGDDTCYKTKGCTPATKLLMFSHFNGVYEEEGVHDGRPRYVERNKANGEPFKVVTPAEIVYCLAIEAWVFRHPDIKTSDYPPNENDCSWLMKTHATDSYNIIELASEPGTWMMWQGSVEPGINVKINCNYCEVGSKESCNYNGVCGNVTELHCECRDGFFGPHCEFSTPCGELRSEKDENTVLKLLGKPTWYEAIYGRPMYVIDGMSDKPASLLRLGYTDTGKDGRFTDDFFQYNNESTSFQELMNNYTFVLRYTGLRWYGDLLPPGERFYTKTTPEEYHAFWDNAFSKVGQNDNSTILISGPSLDLTPVGLDFYEMRRRSVPNKTFDYGPYGILVPLMDFYVGSGFFHCSDKSRDELSSSQTSNSIAVATSSSFESVVCTDTPNWTGKNNVTCEFYMQVNASFLDRCLVWGDKGAKINILTGLSMGVANDNCCICGGGSNTTTDKNKIVV